ncbi:MAG TPA: hypothetical protein VLS25_01385 [Dehalococcoidia bacterium]|nr:hypothetical protein [Dehalococcoidia bacterium]
MEYEKGSAITLRMTVSPDKLREALGSLRLPDAGEASWCIACGASKGAKPLDRVVLPEETRAKFLEPAALASFVKSMRDLGEKAWCIGCGAGKDASPFEKFPDPAEIPDAVIDDLASKVINAVRIG